MAYLSYEYMQLHMAYLSYKDTQLHTEYLSYEDTQLHQMSQWKHRMDGLCKGTTTDALW